MVASGLCHSDDHFATGDITVGHLPFCGGHEGAASSKRSATVCAASLWAITSSPRSSPAAAVADGAPARCRTCATTVH